MSRRRKIPGKKHHGVKDPEQQRQKREEKVRTKVNAAPKGAALRDQQEMPKKMLRMLRLKEDVAARKASRRAERDRETEEDRAKRREDKELLDSTRLMGAEPRLPGMKRPLKPVPVFKQNPGESERRFLNRVEVTCKAVLKRKQYEDKYGVEMVQDMNGQVEAVKDREKDEVEQEQDRLKSARLAKKGIVRRSKEEKRAERRLREKEKRLKRKRRAGKAFREESAREGGELDEEEEGEDKEFDGMRTGDQVAFNEVVQAPPSLQRLPRGAGKESAGRKPGAKADLLLMKKLGKNFKSKKSATADGVSLAKKHMMEEERARVVQEYRNLKKTSLNKVKF